MPSVWYRAGDLVQIRDTSDTFVIAGLLEQCNQVCDIDRAACDIHAGEMLKELTVAMIVKVVDRDKPSDLVACTWVEKDAAE